LVEGGPSSLLLSRDSKESNKLHRRWRQTRFYADVDRQLSGGEPSRHEHSEQHSPHSIDTASDTDAPPVANTSRTQDQTEVKQADVGPSGFEQLSAAPEELATTICTSLLMPSDSWKLLDVYFTNIQSWLPICEKQVVLKAAYSYPTQGLSITADQYNSGSHAELWSILAVASIYDSNMTCAMPLNATSTRPTELYATAKCLVPGETGRFEIGHIKALINLAVFNMARFRTGAAWFLVGTASRALEVMDQSMLIAAPSHKHVYFSCFLLDSLLALQLDRRPHFRKTDLEHHGAIDEDGLEEWQPWAGFADASHEGRRTPLLSLSTFNNLIELVDILVSIEQLSSTLPYQGDVVERLERWKAFVPTKLGYMRSNPASMFLTPPAALLMVTYHCASFASNPSDSNLNRLLEVMEQCQERLGLQRLPPMQCLMAVAERHIGNLLLDDATQARLQSLRTDIIAKWSQPIAQDQSQDLESSILPYRHHMADISIPTPDSLQPIFTNSHPVDRLAAGNLDPFFPGPHPTTELTAPSLSQNDPRYPEVTSDLESFFDELASLDSATRPDNQPQFMQNLGFGPEASMADLFSEYIPMQSTAFLSGDDTTPVNFGQYGFYDAS
jgi:hypothetical protein